MASPSRRLSETGAALAPTLRHRRAVCGDVWVPAHQLPDLGVAGHEVPGSQPARSRRRPSVVAHRRSAWKSAFRRTPHSEHRSVRRLASCCCRTLGMCSITHSVDIDSRPPALLHPAHPQYVGLVAIMFGFLLQWQTLLTPATFPVGCDVCAPGHLGGARLEKRPLASLCSGDTPVHPTSLEGRKCPAGQQPLRGRPRYQRSRSWLGSCRIGLSIALRLTFHSGQGPECPQELESVSHASRYVYDS